VATDPQDIVLTCFTGLKGFPPSCWQIHTAKPESGATHYAVAPTVERRHLFIPFKKEEQLRHQQILKGPQLTETGSNSIGEKKLWSQVLSIFLKQGPRSKGSHHPLTAYRCLYLGPWVMPLGPNLVPCGWWPAHGFAQLQ